MLNKISDTAISAKEKIVLIKKKLGKLQQCDYIVLEGNPFALNDAQLLEVVSHLPNSIKAITFKGNPWAAYSMQQWQNLFGALKEPTIFDQNNTSPLAQITIDLSQLSLQKKFIAQELKTLKEMVDKKGYCAKFSNDDNENKVAINPASRRF